MAMWFGRTRRVVTPVVLQMERAECGAASLGIVLGYNGCWVPLEDLRRMCGVSRDGSRADNIVGAAEGVGLKMTGRHVPAGGADGLLVPFIAFWGGNHFLVVEGVGRRRVWLNDPAIGRRIVSRDQFEAEFSGVALLVERAPEFVPFGKPPSLLRGLGERLSNLQIALLFVMLISLIMVVPGILVPSFNQLFIDYFLTRGFEAWLTPLLLGIAGAAVLQALLTWMQQHYLMRFEQRLSVVWASQLLQHLLRLPINFFAQRNPAELSARAGGTDTLAQILSGSLGSTAFSVPTIIFFGIVMAYYDVVLALLGVGLAVVNLLLLKLWAAGLSERNQGLAMVRNRLSGATVHGLRMIEEYRAAGTDSILYGRLAGLNAQVQGPAQSLGRSRAVLQSIPMFVTAAAGAAVLTVGGFRVMAGELSLGMLVAVQGLMIAFLGPVGQLVGMGGRLQDAQAYIRQIDDLMLHPEAEEFAEQPDAPPPGDAPPADAQVRLTGDVEARAVSFGYSPLQPPLVRDFDLHARSGSWIAIAGPSGSGKSTLAKVLSGLEDPWSGEVVLDGVTLRRIPREVLRRSVAVVDQTISLFEGSLRENISLWDPTMPEDRVVRAAKTACFHDVAALRPGGYEWKLTENGNNLSGGQRALLELSRALAMEPSVLILDEATAALDAVTEARVMANLRHLGCTCILIAHRVSTIRYADEIIVLDHGNVVQRGRHEALMTEDGLYRRLVESA